MDLARAGGGGRTGDAGARSGGSGSRGGRIAAVVADFDAAALADLVRRVGGKPFRERQIREAYFRGARSFDEITVLPIDLRRALDTEAILTSLREITTVGSPSDTIKFLFELHDGRRIESVLLFEKPRITACLSSQVGCPVGCGFCASGLDGLVRNLSATEIVDQYLQMYRSLPGKVRIDHVVLMGMGEPFLNYNAAMEAIRRLNAREGCNIGARKITISTVGIADRILAFAKEMWQVNLAISLHAADDTLRSRLVPFNRRDRLRDILAAARTYFETTGRQVTFEYVLLHEVNDTPEDAEKLARLLKGMHSLVNLIPYNPVNGLEFRAPLPERSAAFLAVLQARGLAATIRKQKGEGDAAACGQLRLITQPDKADE